MPHEHIRRTRFITLCALITLSLGVAAVASAQAIERTLHEYFQTPSSYDALRQSLAGQPDQSPSGSQPPRLPAREPGDPPPLTLSVSEDEPLVGENGPQSSRPMENPQGGLDPLSAQNQLDDHTDRVDELNYYSSFDPSVIPFKRLVSQNLVRYKSGQYIFAVEPGRSEALAIEGDAPQGDEDTFWGTFLVKAQPGIPLPIASVAPNQRILQAQSEPPAPITLSRDEAGNYSMIVNAQGLTRVNLKIAVPRSYFIGDFAPTSWSRLDRTHLIELPDEAYRQAMRVLSDIGLSRRDEPHRVLMELIGYFRAFEGRTFPQELRGDDLYYSIASNKIGVCRHRSFAFVITASAIGIPTRYVYNEAHAFVEVHWPDIGWRRVDLGGAAQDVLMRTQNDGRVHDTGTADTLPQPEAFVEEMNRMAQQEEQRRDRAGQGNGGQGNPPGEDGPMESIDDAPNPSASQDGSNSSMNTDALDPTNDDEPFYDPDDLVKDDRTPVTIRLREPPTQIKRGDSFTFAGSVTTMGDRALAGQEVRIMLSPHHANDRALGRLLGVATTDMNGDFEVTLVIPGDLAIGRWSLDAMFKGDEEYAPATSN